MDELAPDIERPVVGVDRHPRVPAEPELGRLRMGRHDGLALAGLKIGPDDAAGLPRGVDVARIVGLGEHGHAITGSDDPPVGEPDAAVVPHGARPVPTALVLEPAHDVERGRQVHVDVVELAERQVLDEAPGGAAIAREVDPAVVAVDQELAVGAHPERVVIPVHPGLDPAKVFAAVLREMDRPVQVVHAVLVGGVHPDLRVVERPPGDRRPIAALVIHDLPRVAAVVGAQQHATFRLDHGINHLGVSPREVEPHAAELALGKAFFGTQLLPALSPVVRDVEPAPQSTRTEKPRPPPMIPHGRNQVIRIRGIHDQVPRTRGLVHVEHLLPALAPVRRLVNPPLWALLPGIAESTHIGKLRIARMKHDRVDSAG